MHPFTARVAGCLLLMLAMTVQADVLEALLQQLDTVPGALPTQQVTQAALQAGAQVIDPLARVRSAAVEEPTDATPLVAHMTRWTNGLLWVRLGALAPEATRDSAVATLHAALQDAPSGAIVDLRGTGGEDLDALARVAGLIVPAGELLYRVVNPDGSPRTECTSPGPGPGPRPTPMALLTDGGTRGAAALLAGVLRNRPGIMLIGAVTGGDSAFREWISLGDAWTLYTATGWVVPAGDNEPYGRGVRPHLSLPAAPPPAEPPPGRDWPAAVETDPVLRRAADVLLALHALQPAPAP